MAAPTMTNDLRRRGEPGPPRAKTTVTVTLNCWVPGCTGTGEGVRPALADGTAGSGSNGCAGCASDMLTKILEVI